MSFVQDLKEKVLGGYEITREDAIKLLSEDLDELTKAADEIREKFHGDDFDFCSIVNARSGRCSENCKYCAQSSYYHTGAPEYKLLSADEIVADAKKKEAAGIPRYSIVTSGRTLSNRDVEQISEALRRLKKETKLSICLSAGLLNREQFDKLKEAGLTRFHNKPFGRPLEQGTVRQAQGSRPHPLPQQSGNVPPPLPGCLHNAHLRR